MMRFRRDGRRRRAPERGPMGKKSTEQLRLEYKAKRLDRIVGLIETLIRSSALVLCFYFFKGAMDSIAGKLTWAQIGISVLGEFKLADAPPWLVAFFSVLFGLREQRLRRNTIQALA